MLESAFPQVRAVPPAGFEPAAFCPGVSFGPFAGVYRRLSGPDPEDLNSLLACGNSSGLGYVSPLPSGGVWLVSFG